MDRIVPQAIAPDNEEAYRRAIDAAGQARPRQPRWRWAQTGRLPRTSGRS
jgi:hypothetical protein